MAEEARDAPQLLHSWAAAAEDLLRPTAALLVQRAMLYERRQRRSAVAQPTAARESRPRVHHMLECFCGEAPLACTLRDAQGFKILGLDRDKKKVWRNYADRAQDGKPACRGLAREGPHGKCACGKLHEDELLHFPIGQLPLHPAQLLRY